MSESNGYATREQLLAPTPRRYRDYVIDGLGKVRIQSLSELDRSNIEKPNFTKKGEINIEKAADTKCRSIVVAVVDGNGSQLLNNNDIALLRAKDAKVVADLYAAVAEHCGLDKDRSEDHEKNSGPTPGDGSP
jgi:hypothetical protein